MAAGFHSPSDSAADQIARLLSELDVFDQETQILSRQWEAHEMVPRGSSGGNSLQQHSDGLYSSGDGAVASQAWDTWHVPEPRCFITRATLENRPQAGPFSSSAVGENSSGEGGAASKVREETDQHGENGTDQGGRNGTDEHEQNGDALRVRFSGPEAFGGGGSTQETYRVRNEEAVRDVEGDRGGEREEEPDGLEKGEAFVRPKKAAFSFARAPRFSPNEDPTIPPEPSKAASKPVVKDMTNPKPASQISAPSFAKARNRKTIIEELVAKSMPTKDLVYDPEYKLVHKRVLGASFGKAASAQRKKKGHQQADSEAGSESAFQSSVARDVFESLCRNSNGDMSTQSREERELSLTRTSGTEDKEVGLEKSALGPGFYNVEVKLVQKRAPAIGFATLVPREQFAKDPAASEGQLLTLDLTSALGAVSKRVKGVVGFGAGPPRFANEDDKENDMKSGRLELQPNYQALEPRVKGALPYKKPVKADRPRALSPENSQLLTSRSTASSFGTASPMDTPRGVLPSPDPSPLRPRHPAWKFSPSPQQGARLKPHSRPLQQLTPSETLIRPRTEGGLQFGRTTGREGKKDEIVRVRLTQAKQPGPGHYAFAQAWRHLQRHVPSAAFGAMAQRWASASLSSADGVRTALEELSAAVQLTRPRPPAWSFVPVSEPRPVRWSWNGRRSLDVRISFVKRRTAAALGFGAQVGRPNDDVTARNLDRRDYTLHFDLVEPAARAVDFGFGSERQLGGAGIERDDFGVDLDVVAALEATRWRSPQMVPIARQIGRQQLQEESNQDSDFLDPNADLHLKPHVPTVHMSAHPDRWIEARSTSDGPDVGAYDVDRPIGVDAPAVDFALARGRDLATRVRKRLEGDRLILNIDAGWDAVKPSIPAVSLNPLPSKAFNREMPLPEVGFYDPDLTLTKRRLLDVVNMRRMQARQQEDGNRRLPDGERLAAGLGEYPLSDGAIRATIQVPGFGGFKGHVAGVLRGTEGDQLDLELADGFVHPHHWTVSDMERMVGRREEPRDRFTDTDYNPDNVALRPAVSSVRLASQTGHVDGIRLPETGDLDGGCYDGTRVGDRRAPAVDFVSAPPRAILDPYEPSLEGDHLLLPLHSTEPGDAARRPVSLAADFGRASNRWLPQEMALLDRAELGNNLLLRPEISPTKRRAPEVDFSRDRPRWEWADARADAIELYGEGHFMSINPYDGPVQARAPGFDFGKVEGRSAIEAREEKRVLEAMPRGPPVDNERLLEGLRATRFNPPRTNFGKPPLPPIQESVGRGEAAERAFFNRLTKETRLTATPF